MSDGDAKAFGDALKVPDNGVADAKRKARNRRKAAAKKRSRSTKAEPVNWFIREDLKRSGLDDNDARLMQLEAVDMQWCKQHLGTDFDGYKLPYFDFDGKPITEPQEVYRVRHRVPPPQVFKGETIIHDCPKYMQPAGSGVHAYLPPHTDWNHVVDVPSMSALTVEGEKKAARAAKAGIPCIGLGGVDAFGSSKRDIDLLPELARIAKGRPMPIAFDSDIISKEEVRIARKKLALQYFLSGGFPEFIDLPPGENGAKVGLDDYLMTHSLAEFHALPRQAITPQLLVRWLHVNKKKEKLGFAPEMTARLIGRVVTEAMRRNGQFIMTDTTDPELLYFDRASAKIFELDEARGRKLRSFVQHAYDVNGADPQWRQVHEQAANYCAANGLRVTVHKLAFYDRKTHTLYVARSEGQLFKITARGRTIVPNGTDHVFIRTDGRLKDVDPASKGTRKAFEQVSHTANFKNNDVMGTRSATLLWEVWQLGVFFPQIMKTRPLVLFTGEPGSRKTSAGRAFGQSLMGSTFNVSAVNKDKLDDLDAAIVGCPLVVIDNVDGNIPGIENKLAIAATGGNLVKRKLYITMQDVSLPYDAYLVLTSVIPRSLTREDVVSRELLLFCIPSDKGFKLEAQVQAEIEDNRPQWWAFVLEHLSKIVAALARPRQQTLEDMRLADFAGFVRVVGPVLGYTVKEVTTALTAMVAAKIEFVASMSSLPDALATVVDNRLTEFYHAFLADGKNGKEYTAKLADISKRRSASDLRDECEKRVKSFKIENPKAFGTMLVSQLKAIQTKIDMDVEFDKHAKQNDYSISPQGGWVKALDAHVAAVKAAEQGQK